MPALHPGLINTAFYIYPSKDDAKNSAEFGGTGFLFGIQSDVAPNLWFTYAVTCWHVIRNHPNPVIRINTRDGKYDTIETKSDDWIRHPNGDDVAILRLSFGAKHNYLYGQFTLDHLVTDELIKTLSVSPGDEVVMIGRFRVHAGRKKNIPAFMFGYISMMPDEPIYNPETDLEQDSYLVEMRSISGFSGSPVILWIPPLSPRPTSARRPE